MNLKVNTILLNLKNILPIGDTNAYDDQMIPLIKSAMSKLEIEGVENIYEEAGNVLELSNDACDYIVCIAYQVARDMDFELDSVKLDEQYLTRVNTLRTRQSLIKANANNKNRM